MPEWLAEAVVRGAGKHNYYLWAYVFMPEHVHLLVCPQTPEYDMAVYLKSIKQPVSRRARDWLETDEPDRVSEFMVKHGSRDVFCFWQAGPGYDRNIHSEKELPEKILYIHGNPVSRGLVGRPEDWLWSSAAWYAGKRDGPLRVDDCPLAW
ncbi:MAG: hypothetical protein HY897_24745 [Deltaproteobacteria bacterium]|nr:hypothetical protein [Deltaproteobacteria bacterium]